MAKKMVRTLAFILLVCVAIGGGYFYVNSTTATLILKMKDPPVDWGVATEIRIHYSAIEIHRRGGGDSFWIKILDEGWINLSTVIDAEKAISETNLDPGIYDKIRFEVLEAEVTIGATNMKAALPSGKLNLIITGGGVSMTGGETSELLIDIQPRVIGSPKNGYTVIPTVKATPIM